MVILNGLRKHLICAIDIIMPPPAYIGEGGNAICNLVVMSVVLSLILCLITLVSSERLKLETFNFLWLGALTKNIQIRSNDVGGHVTYFYIL